MKYYEKLQIYIKLRKITKNYVFTESFEGPVNLQNITNV